MLQFAQGVHVYGMEETTMTGKLGQIQPVHSTDQHGHGFTLSGDGSSRFPLTFGFKTEADARAARKELAKLLDKAVFVIEADHLK